MKDYIFVLGRDPRLSLAELSSYFLAYNIQYKIRETTDEIAVISLNELNFRELIKNLGGILKIGEVIFSGDPDTIEYELNKHSFYEGTKNKLNFGISVYDYSDLFELTEEYFKARFKEERLKVIYKKSKEHQLMPSKTANILENGVEILLFRNYLAKTIAFFNPDDYKEKEKERPVNDFSKSISIRLAKILINLAQVKGGTILDPFCGTGIILEEALSRNINVIGIDNDIKTVESALENLGYLAKKIKATTNFTIKRGDATKLNLLDRSVDAIVTEPYLGPLLKGSLEEEEAKIICNDLEKIYTGFLESAKSVLKPNARIVIIVPKFRVRSVGLVYFNFNGILHKTGYKIDDSLFPWPYNYNLKSIIKREIYVLKES